jgi:hypothetical protein
VADEDTRDTRGPKSWNRFDARLAALAAATAGDRPRPADDPMRPFDTVVASIAISGQPEKPAPADKPITVYDSKVAAMLAEANSSGAGVPTAAAPPGVIEAEKPAAPPVVEAEFASRSGGQLPAGTVVPAQVHPAETAEDIARRKSAELAGESQTATPPPPPVPAPAPAPAHSVDVGNDLVGRLNSSVEPRPLEVEHAPRLADVEPEPTQGLRIEPEPAQALRIEPQPDQLPQIQPEQEPSLRIDPDRDRPAPIPPEEPPPAEVEPVTQRDGVEAEITRLVEEGVEPRPVDVASAAAVGLLGAVLVIGLVTARNYAISIDEFIYDAFGNKALASYRDAFTDLSSPIYAPWFQAITALVQSFGLGTAFDVRHTTTFVIGLLGLAALIPIGKLAIGRWAGFVAIVLCLMTGAFYGQLFFAPTDVPFMAAMTWATMAVIVMVRREVPAWWATIGAGLFTGLAVATRPDGILVHLYLIVAVLLCALEILLRGGDRKGRALMGLVARLAVALVLAGVVAVALSPWLQRADALEQLKSAFEQFLAAPADETVRSWGRELSRAALPWFYAPGELAARLPEGFLILLAVAVLAAIAATLAFIGGCLGKIGEQGVGRALKTTGLLLAFLMARSRGALVVVMAALVPLVIVMLMRPPLGDGIRQLLYVIPPLALLAAWGLLSLMPLVRRFPVGAAAVAGAAVAWSVIALIVLHPLEYMATNAFAGGTRGSYGRFELDPNGAAATEALRRLEQRLAYDTSGRYASRTPSIHVCLPGAEQVVTPMFKRAWIIEPNPLKADFIIETDRMRCGKGSEGVVIDEVKRFDVPFAWTIESAARIPNRDQVRD